MNLSTTDIKLFELFADKTLSEGCIIKIDWKYEKPINFSKSRKYPRFWDEEDEDVSMSMSSYKKIWHEPQLHDVFRVAKEKEIYLCIWIGNDEWLLQEDWLAYQMWEDWPMDISYNPTISLLAQSDFTKSKLIDLFTP